MMQVLDSRFLLLQATSSLVKPWTFVLALSFFLFTGYVSADHVAPDDIREVLPRDAIIAVRTPKFADVDYLHPSLPVIGLVVNGDARAYPLLILNHHEIVNDVVGGVPVAVTFCPLCNTALVYDRRVGDTTLTFGVSGLLYRSNLIMYDEETESLWLQITSEAIQGPLHGARLEPLTATIVEWNAWRESHPQSLLLDFPLPQCDSSGIIEDPIIVGSCIDYTYNPYSEYILIEDVFFGSDYTDRILHPKAVVLGVTVGEVSMAYPYESLTREVVVNDTVKGLQIVVTFHASSAKAFEREGRNFHHHKGRTMIDDLGQRWDMVTGEGDAETLKEVTSTMAFWFTWAEFHEGTGVYGYREPAPSQTRGSFEPIYVIVPAISLTAVAAYLYGTRKSREP